MQRINAAHNRKRTIIMLRRNLLAAGLGLPFLVRAQAQTDTAQGSAPSSKRILLIGVDPGLVDYSKLPELNAEKLGAILDGQKDRLLALGCAAQWCFIDTGTTAQRKVVEVLRAAEFDVISIGAGVRLPPENLLLFERVVNAVHHHAPQARICFSKTANDTVEAVERWL